MGSHVDSRPAPRRHLVGASVRGPSHARLGLPNQDAMGWLPDVESAPEFVVCVADGHGSGKCFRSHVGSRMAVEVGLDAGQRFLAAAAGDSPTAAATRARDELPDSIVATWKLEVDNELARQPFTEAELLQVEHSDGSAGRQVVETSPRLAYGTTLLVALIAADWVVLLQVGDGDILVVPQSGKTSRPMPRDPRLIGNETTSLSAPSAQDDFRVAAVAVDGDGPALAVLATDGFSNAYADDAAFLQVGPDLLTHVRQSGVDAVAERLEAWLETASRHDGDDVTVVIVAFGGSEPPQPDEPGGAMAAGGTTRVRMSEG